MKLHILILLLLYKSFAFSQELNQTIRGEILDKDSRFPLVGAQVLVKSGDLNKGAVSDEQGRFRIEDVPTGRVDIQITYLGYQSKQLSQIELNSAKELVLMIEMEEKVVEMGTATVTARRDKSKTINGTISVSGRTFSVEESQRYAGSRGDVARMAQNFAGVQGSDDSRNDIVVRGNSPTGVLYRLEGIDIPNPNHFAASGTTGGPVSMLNNNILANSDFISGAFPAEYGNAVAAVFDLGLRKGNNENHEFLGQIGFAGFELMAEGPIKEGSQASYLINARYSTLKVFSLMGLDFGTGTAVPNYYDLSWHVYLPAKKGHWKFFGLAGNSAISFIGSEGEADNLYSENGEDLIYGSATAMAGVSRFIRLNKKSFLRLSVASDAGQVRTQLDTFDRLSDGSITEPAAFYRDFSLQGKHSFVASYQYKLNARNTFKAGLRTYLHYFRLEDSVYNQEFGRWVRLTDYNGNTSTAQSFVNWQHKFNDRFQMNAGMNYLHFFLNQTGSIEPRLGLSYQLRSTTSINFGYGLHSQIPAFRLYFYEVEDVNGNRRTINENLAPYKSHHLVLGLNQKTGKHSRLKFEAYYQHLFNVPIDEGDQPYYSYLNQGADFGVEFTDSMRNEGQGRNYGIEVTAERFLNNGFYYLNTLSLFRSFYTDRFGKEHSTAFDNRYALNLLAGKEYELNSKKGDKQQSITIDLRFMMNGGRRYTPVLEEESQIQQEVVYDLSRSFSSFLEPYYRADLRIAYKSQGKRVSQEWGVDIQNLTNRQNIFRRVYNPQTNNYETTYQTGLLPIMLYRILF